MGRSLSIALRRLGRMRLMGEIKSFFHLPYPPHLPHPPTPPYPPHHLLLPLAIALTHSLPAASAFSGL